LSERPNVVEVFANPVFDSFGVRAFVGGDRLLGLVNPFFLAALDDGALLDQDVETLPIGRGGKS
jgi:hypothetical protein